MLASSPEYWILLHSSGGGFWQSGVGTFLEEVLEAISVGDWQTIIPAHVSFCKTDTSVEAKKYFDEFYAAAVGPSEVSSQLFYSCQLYLRQIALSCREYQGGACFSNKNN